MYLRFNSKVVRFNEWKRSTQESVDVRFNSKVVRFNEVELHRHAVPMVAVSIPKWCDSMPSSPCSETSNIQFQFQSGAIQCRKGRGHLQRILVSIPKWCDSMISFHLTAICALVSFNSKVVRFNETRPDRRFKPMRSFNSKVVRFNEI